MAPLFQETAEHLDGSRHGDIREWQDHKANDRPFSTAHRGRQPGPPRRQRNGVRQTLTLQLPQDSLGPALQLAFPSLVNGSISHSTGLLEKLSLFPLYFPHFSSLQKMMKSLFIDLGGDKIAGD